MDNFPSSSSTSSTSSTSQLYIDFSRFILENINLPLNNQHILFNNVMFSISSLSKESKKNPYLYFEDFCLNLLVDMIIAAFNSRELLGSLNDHIIIRFPLRLAIFAITKKKPQNLIVTDRNKLEAYLNAPLMQDEDLSDIDDFEKKLTPKLLNLIPPVSVKLTDQASSLPTAHSVSLSRPSILLLDISVTPLPLGSGMSSPALFQFRSGTRTTSPTFEITSQHLRQLLLSESFYHCTPQKTPHPFVYSGEVSPLQQFSSESNSIEHKRFHSNRFSIFSKFKDFITRCIHGSSQTEFFLGDR